MTKTIAALFAMSVCLALAVRIWVGPPTQERLSTQSSQYDVEPMTTPPSSSNGAPEQVTTAAAMPAATRAVARSRTRTGVLISPGLARHVQPLLNNGANITIAADGFRSAAEFVTVARASRNTGVPFMLLKHRVVTEGRSLARAIESSKPELDGVLEERRATAEARVDMAYVAS